MRSRSHLATFNELLSLKRQPGSFKRLPCFFLCKMVTESADKLKLADLKADSSIVSMAKVMLKQL